MRFFKKAPPKPNYQHIAELERDLGLDDATIAGNRTRKRVLPKAVILSPRSAPLDALELRPRFKWPVSNHGDIQPFQMTAVCASSMCAPEMYAPRVSPVVLPPGVQAS